jgi:hypothetical protein
LDAHLLTNPVAGRGRLAIIGCILTLAVVTLSPVALSSGELSFGIAGNNQLFTSSQEASSGGVIELSVSGGVPSTVRVELVDIYADELGDKRPLPLNSSPFTPEGLVDFPRIAGTYVPNGETQRIEVPFTFLDPSAIDRPVLGGLRLTVVPDASEEGDLSLTSAIVATFAYYPDGMVNSLAGGIQPELAIESPSFERTAGDLFPFSLLPDFPMVFNFGPISATTSVRNTGNIFLDVRSQVSVQETNFFGGSVKEPFIRTAPQESFLVPNQQIEFTDQLQGPSAGDEPAVALPRIGIFEVVTTTTGTLGQSVSVTSTESKLLILFPWKYALALLMLIGVLVLRTYLGKSRSVKEVLSPIES